MISRKYGYILILYFFVCNINGQETIKDIVTTFKRHVEDNPVEKIYLHLDKPYYAAGEYMYFRAYLTDIHLNQKNAASNIIYAELSDEEKQIVKRALLYSEENEFAGQFQLPDSLPSANYHLRAYTNWMRNAGEEYFYHRDIYIGHPTEHKILQEKTFDYQVGFYPEGGHLLYDVPNKIAFKAVGNDGFGINITGTLTDNLGNKLVKFNSLHGGMGMFEFTPQENRSYKAAVSYDNIIKECTLPSATEGTILSVTQSEDSVYLTIKSNKPGEERITIIGQSRHTICYAVEGLRKEQDYTITLSKKEFPTGIAQFTLLKEGFPISERLLFIDKKDDLLVTITSDKDKYGDREKVMLDIEITDKGGNPVEGSFSLAVTDDKVIIPSIGTQNIKGSLLLDSDLKGFIENPGWYFADNDTERKEALDILLCTQGWTRYTREGMNNPSEKYYYPVESEFQITGKVTNLIGRPVKESEVLLFSSNNIPGIAKTEKNGRFGFYGFDCPDSTVFVIQSRTKNNRKTFIGIEIDKPDNFAKIDILPLDKKKNEKYTTEISYIEQATRQIQYDKNIWTIQLSEITVTSIRNEERFTRTNSFLFEGEKINKPYAIRNILYTLPNPNPGPEGLLVSIENALYIVDGVEIDFETWDYSYSRMPVNMFESIEILRPVDAAIFGVRGSFGAYIIKTRKFEGKNITSDASIQIYQPEGYCVRKEFYIPPYDKPEVKQNPTPDLRSTIYWNPVIKTDTDGQTKVEFYTGDNVQTYSYTLEGIGNNNITTIRYKK